MAELGYILRQDLVSNLNENTIDELTGGRKAISTTPSTPAIDGDDNIWQSKIPSALEMMLGHTRHWYDMPTEISSIVEYDVAQTYTVGQRVASTVDAQTNLRTLYVALQAVPAGTLLTNTAFFEQRDSRNPVLVEIVCHLIVYHISRRINPRQLPEQRILDYDNAMAMLKKIQRGEVDLDIPKRAAEDVETDDAGQRIAWGDFEEISHYNY